MVGLAAALVGEVAEEPRVREEGVARGQPDRGAGDVEHRSGIADLQAVVLVQQELSLGLVVAEVVEVEEGDAGHVDGRGPVPSSPSSKVSQEVRSTGGLVSPVEPVVRAAEVSPVGVGAAVSSGVS